MTRYKFKKYSSQIEDWINIIGSVDNLNYEDVLVLFLGHEQEEEEIEFIESDEEYLLRLCSNLLTYCENKEYYNYCTDILNIKKTLQNEINKTNAK